MDLDDVRREKWLDCGAVERESYMYLIRRYHNIAGAADSQELVVQRV